MRTRPHSALERHTTEEQERTLKLTDLVHKGDWWTTYGTIGEIVYGCGKGAQTVGNALRDYASTGSAHRVLKVGGMVSKMWHNGGPDKATRRLQDEGVGDGSRNCARKDRFIDAEAL